MKTDKLLVENLMADLENGKDYLKDYEANQNRNSKILLLSLTFFRTFPSKIEDFTTYLHDAIPYLYLHSPQFISVSNKAALELLYDHGVLPTLDYLQIRVKTTDSTVDNDYWDQMLATRRHEIEQLLLIVFHDIIESAWTEEARTKLRRPAKATTHTAAPILEYAPMMTIVSQIHLGIKLHLHNPLTPDTDEMPVYQHVSVEYFIGDKGLDPATIVFGNARDVKHQYFMLNFIEANVGKWVYIRARYVNSKGEVSLYWTVILASPIV